MNATLKISNLNAYYEKALVLHNVSIDVGPGERVAILGRNGMGKTTLLKSVMKLDKVRVEGSIRYGSVELTKLPTYGVARQGIGYVPQGWQLFRSLSVEEHLLMAYRKGSAGQEWTPQRVVDTFPEIGRRRKIGGTRLSGGEQQRVSVARALAKKPKVLFLDEPTGALDEQTGRQVLDYICKLQKEYGFTIVLVTHNLNIAEMATTVIKMNSGKVTEIYTNEMQKTAYEIGW
mgnify:CR=1 FL=1